MNITTTLSPEATATYLRTLPAIRERCGRVYDLAKKGQLQYFDYHPEREPEVTAFCIDIIKRDFGSNLSSIPPHGRWRHLDAGSSRVEPLIQTWKASSVDNKEISRRLIDLFLVSVLLDAGAGSAWSYRDSETGQNFSRSEGLGVASIKMFEAGLFSGDAASPHQVDPIGLSRLTTEKIAAAMQVTESNPMVGLEGRASLLKNLGKALQDSPQYFGPSARPGGLIDFLETTSKLDGPVRRVHIAPFWAALIEGLSPIWPLGRTNFGGVPLGDVWPCGALQASAKAPGDDLVPFHKLTGWITYSLIEPMENILGWKFEGLEDMTGLPEYRNGGLFVDLGVLTLRPNALEKSLYPDPSSLIPRLPPSHPAIVEWRAMTVIGLDRTAAAIRRDLGISDSDLSLAQVLESATWKGGREIAKQKRPATGGPPIDIQSDGTVF